MCLPGHQKLTLTQGDALIVVDVQNDFLPSGSLAVPQGDEVVPALNRYLTAFIRRGLPIIVTRDWHPPNHCSFQPMADRGPLTVWRDQKARHLPLPSNSPFPVSLSPSRVRSLSRTPIPHLTGRSWMHACARRA